MQIFKQMKALIFFLGVISASSAVNEYLDWFEADWDQFKFRYKKTYTDETRDKLHLKIFVDNCNTIFYHNRRYEKGLVSFRLRRNQFADLAIHEFVRSFKCYNPSRVASELGKNVEAGVTFVSPANFKLPQAVNWRMTRAVTRVRDQEHCGSCWAFSAAGSLEGQHFCRNGVEIELSAQNLIDCSGSHGNEGCNGGLMDNAFRYIIDNGGIDTENSYPYKGFDDSCHFNRSTVGTTVKGFVKIPEGNETKLMEAIATIGPVSVAIDASHESFVFYSKGLYYEPVCDSQELNHAVLVVGYGTEANGADYWLVKNSWGRFWGDDGFIKMARNRDNNCGIATAASYPLL